MDTLVKRIIAYGDKIGRKHFDAPKGEVLLDRFVNSLEFSDDTMLIAKTADRGEVRVSLLDARKILITDVSKHIGIGKEEIAIAFIDWQVIE